MSTLTAGARWALSMLPTMVREARAEPEGPLPILVSGAAPLAGKLADALRAGGAPELVRTGAQDDLESGAGSISVHVVAGELGPEDERSLRAGERALLPLVCLVVGEPPGERRILPYVKATDVVYTATLDDAAVEAVAARIAARAGERAYALARELPALRPHVARSLVRSYARKNALLGAAIFIPGADLPVLTVNEMRMVRRIADAYGVEQQQARFLMLVGVAGAGLGFRAIARTALGIVPFALPVKAAVAYGGTQAIGRAAIARLEK